MSVRLMIISIRASLLFLITCCLLPVVVSANDPESKTILIFAEINEPGLSSEIYHDFPPGQSNFSLPFYIMLRDTLVTEGFEPVFIRASSDEHYPDFFEPVEDYQDRPNFWKQVISISPVSYGEADWVTLTPFAGYQFPPLPMGTSSMSTMPRISAERSTSLEEVVNLSAGVALYTSYHCDAALPFLVEATANQPLMEDGVLVYAGAMFYRAGCEYDQGLIEDAIVSYQAVMDYPYEEGDFDLRRFTEYAAINLAYIYAQQGKQEQGVELLDLYTTTDYGIYSTREIERFLKRADLYLAMDANDAAIGEITRLIEIAIDANAEAVNEGNSEWFAPNVKARLYTERGQRYWQTGQPTQALIDFNHAILIDDQYPKVYYWRGVLRYTREDFSQSKADFEKFLELAPDYYEYYEEDFAPYIEQTNDYLAQLAESE